MPKKLEKELIKEAIKKNLTGKDKDRYVYGTLAKIKESIKRKKNNG